MSMSTYVRGFRKPDDKKFEKYAKVWQYCVEAGVGIPEEVFDYFNCEEPDARGIEVNIDEAISPYTADMEEGYEVDLSKLPKDLKIIRFYNSY